MVTPTLVVAGDNDVNPRLTTRGADWHADPYTLSPGAKWLLTLTGRRAFTRAVSRVFDAKGKRRMKIPTVWMPSPG